MSSEPPLDIEQKEGMLSKIRSRLSNSSVLQKAAATALLVKIGAAGLGFLTQTLLAQFLGAEAYGTYSYFWVWIMVGTIAAGFGLSEAAIRFLAEYRETERYALYSGFISSSLQFVSVFSVAFSLIGFGLAIAFADQLSEQYFWLICLSLACIPVFALQDLVTGFALAFSWTGLAHVPPYIMRQLLILLSITGLMLIAYPASATVVLTAALAAGTVSLLVQGFLFFRAARKKVPQVAQERNFRLWIKTAFPMFMADGFQLILSFSDIIILGMFLEPEWIALYYAATRISTQVGSVQFSIASAVAQRMSGLNATDKIDDLHQLIAQTSRWIFWPTFAVFCGIVALGWPLLRLFGSEFTAAYWVLIILAAGSLVQSSVGAAEDVLKMVGHERVEFWIKAGTTVLNLILNLTLIPILGIYGAALATSVSLMTYTILSEIMVRRFVGTTAFVFSPRRLKGDAT